MSNHTVDCDYCGEDMRGLSGVRGCYSAEEAAKCYRNQKAATPISQLGRPKVPATPLHLIHETHKEFLIETLAKMLRIGKQYDVPEKETALSILNHLSIYERTYVPPKKSGT